MTTIEDFKNAPVGATATHEVTGIRAMKTYDSKQYWITQMGKRLNDEEMGLRHFTLDRSAPATTREALDLAWELAHRVKPGQFIPKGTRYVTVYNSGLGEYTVEVDIKIPPAFAPEIRTLDPLPDPEPDWLDAPAVLAVHDSYTKPSIWGKHWDQERLAGYYQSALTAGSAHWSELENVTPLYPKEGQEA